MHSRGAIGSLLLAAAMGAGARVVKVGDDLLAGDERSPKRGPRPAPKPVDAENPRVNRWTGEPHQHGREVARRLRQRERRS